MPCLESEHSLSTYLNQQRSLLTGFFKNGQIEKATFLEQRQLFFWNECDLSYLLHALNAHCGGYDYPLEKFTEKVSIFKNEHFSWGEILYPRFHAEYVGLLFLLAYFTKNETLMSRAEKGTTWHIHALDHRHLPFFSLWAQEGSSYRELLLAHYLAFKLGAIFCKNSVFYYLAKQQKMALEGVFGDSDFAQLVEAIDNYFQEDPLLPANDTISARMRDDSLLLWGERARNHSFFCTGIGCKSGIGALHIKNIGITNYGPQLLPLGDCEGFGIVGRKEGSIKIEGNNSEAYFTCAVAAPLPSTSKKQMMQDSGFSGFWVEVKHTYQEKKWEIIARLHTLSHVNKVCFSFYLKGTSCCVASIHKLRPRSLDRYRGPASALTIEENGTKFVLVAEECSHVEVIPLAGGDSFWGADFLAAFTFSGLEARWSVEL